MAELKPMLIMKSKAKKENVSEKAVSIADLRQRLLVNTADLMRLTGYGRTTAIRIGTEANAKVCLGRKIMWSVEAVEKYLESISS